MPFVRMAFFPGGTASQYEALVRELHGAEIPAARRAFLAGQADDGWQVIQVWDDKEALDRFNRLWLFPALERLGSRGFPSQPIVRDFEATEVALSPPQLP